MSKKKTLFGFTAQTQTAIEQEQELEHKEGMIQTEHQEEALQEKQTPTESATSKGEQTRFLESFIDEFTEKKKQKTVEETHTRQTFLMRNDLKKRLDRLARKHGKGFKTAILNRALEAALDEIEGKK